MSDTVNQQYIDWLSQVCNAQVLDTQMIQPLWSGYGACFRATLGYPNNTFSKNHDERSPFQESQYHQAQQNPLGAQQGERRKQSHRLKTLLNRRSLKLLNVENVVINAAAFV